MLITSAFGVPAAVIGSRLSRAVPGNGHALMIATAALVGYTAYRTAFPSTPPPDESLPETLRESWWLLGLIGVAAGALSGLLGIGGGILMVPAFSTLVGLPLKETIATSLACVGVFAIPGTITHAIQGDINWTFALPLAAGVIPGARIGAHFTIGVDRSHAALHRRHRARRDRGDLRRSASCCAAQGQAARSNTASSISGVSRPVNVFCWLGWNAPSTVIGPHCDFEPVREARPPGAATRRPAGTAGATTTRLRTRTRRARR